MTANLCHFELSLESEKSIKILKYALNLWIAANLRAFALQTLAMTILVKFILTKQHSFEKRVKFNFF